MEPFLELNSSQSNGNTVFSGGDSSDSKETWREYLREKILGKKSPSASVHANAYEYNMSHLKRGKAIIFNHKMFAQPDLLRTRNGTDVDRDLLDETFKYLGFEVNIYNDLTSKQIFTVLKNVSEEDHTNNDCLAVAVLSHGTTDSLNAFDETYKTELLWDMFTADNCGTLAGKPKLFFILACRGDLFDEGTKLKYKPRRFATDGGNDVEYYKIPNQADFLTVFSTYPGYYSWRNSSGGSFFIRALCTVMKDHCDDLDVLTMMTFVNREVAINYESNRPDDLAYHMKKQMPQVCHTLIRQVYFLRKYNEVHKTTNGTLV